MSDQRVRAIVEDTLDRLIDDMARGQTTVGYADLSEALRCMELEWECLHRERRRMLWGCGVVWAIAALDLASAIHRWFFTS